MGHTYSSLFFHLIWSTKDRLPLIKKSFCNRLYNYIGGVVKGNNFSLLSIGGMPDHVHLLVKTTPLSSVSDLVRLIKSNSSKKINQEFLNSNFCCQEGYGVFSVSISKLNVVQDYIYKQEKHHKKYNFEDEFARLLEKHEIEYNKEFLFR